MLVTPTARRVRRAGSGDEGSTLVAVLIVGLVLSMLAIATSIVVVNTAQTTAAVRSSLQAQAAADAGIAAAVAEAKANPAGICSIDLTNPTAPQYSVAPAIPSPDRPGVTACGTGGRVTFLSIGTGDDGATAAVEATYYYAGGVASGVPDNAMVIGGGTFSATSLMLSVGTSGDDGSALMLSGDFKTCNNITTFDTDVILYNGNMDLTNSCTFKKDVYVAGYVKLDSGVKVEGTIYSLGTVSIENSTVTVGHGIVAKGDVTVKGKVGGSVTTERNFYMEASGGSVTGSVTVGGDASVKANSKITGSLTVTGKATLDNATIDGDLRAGSIALGGSTVTGDIYSASTDSPVIYNLTAGSITIAGTYGKHLQASKITRDVVSTKTGVNYIAPDTTVGGKIRFAGTASTEWGPATATGGNVYNVAGLTAPTVPTKPAMTIPDPLKSGTYKWDDYNYVADNWIAGGYKIDVWATATECKFDAWNPANVNKITSYTDPTVVDLRGCGTVSGFQTTLQLDTDLLIVLPDNGKEHKFQEVLFSSKDGEPHKLDLMTPDTVDNDAPTCLNSGSKLNLYAVTASTSPLISGLIYSPCTLSIANVGSKGNWTGQLYSGSMIFDAGGAPGYQLVYEPIGMPGFGTSAVTAPELGALIGRRAVTP